MPYNWHKYCHRFGASDLHSSTHDHLRAYAGEEKVERSIAWLLDNGSAPVRYMTLLRIVGEDPSSTEMRALWREAQRHPDNVEMFSKQRADGSWCDGGSWAPKPSYVPQVGCTPVSPQYVTTPWLLSVLGDAGYTVAEPKVSKSLEWVQVSSAPMVSSPSVATL